MKRELASAAYKAAVVMMIGVGIALIGGLIVYVAWINQVIGLVIVILGLFVLTTLWFYYRGTDA